MVDQPPSGNRLLGAGLLVLFGLAAVGASIAGTDASVSVNASVMLVIAAAAAYVGIHWERARRALSEIRR
jgi:hypothetical protein